MAAIRLLPKNTGMKLNEIIKRTIFDVSFHSIFRLYAWTRGKINSFIVSNIDNESMYFLSYTYGGGLVGTPYTSPFLWRYYYLDVSTVQRIVILIGFWDPGPRIREIHKGRCTRGGAFQKRTWVSFVCFSSRFLRIIPDNKAKNY